MLSVAFAEPAKSEPLAVRMATNRLAMNTQVGPHHGPGSGAPLNYLISKMRGAVEKLELWQDDSDTDRESIDSDTGLPEPGASLGPCNLYGPSGVTCIRRYR